MNNAVNLIRTTLGRANDLFRGGNLDDAEQLVRSLLIKFPTEANSLHLMGLILKAKGDLQGAHSSLLSALRNGADAIAINTAIGSLFYAQKEYDKALSIYNEVLSKVPEHADALYNSSLCAIALGNGQDALAKSQKGAKKYPQAIQFRYTLARAHELLGNISSAEEAYREALELNPQYFHATYSYGLLLRQQGRLEEARDIMKRATNVQPKAIDAWYVLANICYQLGQSEDAIAAFEKVLSINPAHVEAHRFLNNLYHEFGYEDKFATSFQVGVKADPSSIPMRLTQIDALLEAERYDECSDAIENANNFVGNHAIFNARKGTLAARRGDLDRAVFHMEKACELDANDVASATSLARFLIGLCREEKALDILDNIEHLSPFDQNLWALRGTAWTLMGENKKADWLFGYDCLVRAEVLEVPEGFSALEDFLFELQQRLEELHTTKNAPINQTLRNGTQTIGRLFDHKDTILSSYKNVLIKKITDIVSDLPDDATHPFLSRNTGKIDIATSWSVRLTKEGFHISHVHPVGWLSSAFYVAFDQGTVGDNVNDPAGWLHFGVPGIDLPGRKVEPARLIRPEPGLLALFPSYCWHGTYPIENEGMRLTAPFDVVPK
jgi:tetratricopeptide (TPR) repeat protein